jgi:hypothetical protein
MESKYAHKCDDCGAGMNEGYVIAELEPYMQTYCSDECLHKHITPAEFEELYDDGDGNSYWTEWEGKA